MNNNAVTAGDPAETTAEQPATVNKPQGKWKKLPCAFRDRLCELDGYTLKVWLAYLLHGNDEGVAWPSRSTLRRETGLSEDWISKARTALKKKGWLVLEGGGRDDKGRLDAPRLRAIIPEATHADVMSSRCETVAVKERHDEDHADHADVNHVDRAEVTSAISRTTKEVDTKEGESATVVAAARDFAFETYRNKFGETPNWMNKDFIQLANLFKRKDGLTVAEFKRRWTFYLKSTDKFIALQGYGLAFFCSKMFDGLRNGPVDESGSVATNPGVSRKELERRRNYLSPESKRMYADRGTRPQ
jgi:hypothetical protein